MHELKSSLDAEERRRSSRANLVGWACAAGCFGGLVGTFVLLRQAGRAVLRGAPDRVVYSYMGLSLASFALLVAGYVILRRREGREPFTEFREF